MAISIVSSPNNASKVNALIRDISGAMTLAEIRSAYLDAASQVISAEGIGFYRLGRMSGDAPLEISSNLDPQFLHDYEKVGRADDPVLQYVIEHRVPVDSGRLRRIEWDRCGSREVLSQAKLKHSMQAPLLQDDRVVGTINFARSGLQPFTDEELSTAKMLSEHLGIALERAHRFDSVHSRVVLLERALERSARAAMVCSPDGTPLFVSSRATDLLGFSFNDAVPRGLAAQVLDLVRALASAGGRAHTSHIEDPGSHRRLVLKIQGLRASDSYVCFIYADPGTEPAGMPKVDVLSAREQEIAEMVARGLTTNEIATRAFISASTVKHHLKRIFAKLGVTTRASLVQTMWAMQGEDVSGESFSDEPR